MDYAFLLMPHANIRYRASLETIAKAELMMMLSSMGREAQVIGKNIGEVPFLIVSTPSFSKKEWALISQHSSIYMACELKDGALIPLSRTHPAYVGEDLPSLLKYKGKTNEMFSDALLSMALCSSSFAQKPDAQLTVCDPLCGRGTTLFLALRRGWHSVGVEADKADVKESTGFFTRYLEFHRMKHKKSENALTVRGKNGGRETRYIVSDTPEHFKDGDTRTLSIIQGDTRDADVLMKNTRIALMATDLPYGVQHGASGGEKNLMKLLDTAFESWFNVLARGGAIAISFNTYVTRRNKLKPMLEKAGFTVCEGGAYESLEHWVEQAVNRDIIVAVKPIDK